MASPRANDASAFKPFPAVDLMKFLCALLVVTIHVPPVGENVFSAAWLINYGIQQYLARIAVPFFFMCTGFLLFRKTTPGSFTFSAGFRRACKTYRFYLIWTVLYLPLIIRNILRYEGGVLYGTTVFLRDFVFTGSYFHLWYLNAAAFAVLLVSILVAKKVKRSLIIGIAFVLYLLGLLTQSWTGLVWNYRSWPIVPRVIDFLSKTMVTARNGLFEAFLFVSIGMLLAFRPIRLSAAKAAAGFVCSMMLLFAEVVVLARLEWIRENDMYLFLVPAVFFLFLGVIGLDLKNHSRYRTFRGCSSLIFFVHVGLDELVCSLFISAGLDPSASSLRFAVVLAASIALAFTLVRLSALPRLRWLQKLYS